MTGYFGLGKLCAQAPVQLKYYDAVILFLFSYSIYNDKSLFRFY